MAWNYSDKTKKLFLDAINNKENTHIGEIENPDGEGFHGSLVCGDAIKLTFSVKKDEKNPENDVITQVRYLTFGCTSAIAASEALCILLEDGHFTPIKALSLTKDDIVNFLEGLPTQKIHCSIMGVEALFASIHNWARKRGVDLKKFGVSNIECTKGEETKSTESKNDANIICRCMGMTRGYIIDQIKDLKLKTVDDIINTIKAGSVCGMCIDEPGGLNDLLNEVNGSKTETTEKAPQQKTPYQIAKEIETVLNEEIIPILKNDGGGIEIVDIRGYELYFRLKGTCKTCHSANNTIEYTIQKILRDRVGKDIKVIHVD